MKNNVNRRKFIKQAATGTILAFGMGASAYQPMTLWSGHPITITAGASSGSSGGHPSSSVSVGGGFSF